MVTCFSVRLILDTTGYKKLCTGNGLHSKTKPAREKTEKYTKPISGYSQAPIQFTALVLYKRKRSYNFTGYHQIKLTGFKTHPPFAFIYRSGLIFIVACSCQVLVTLGNLSKLTRRPRGGGHIQISIQLRVINVRGRVNSLGLESF